MSAYPLETTSRIIDSRDERISRLPTFVASCSVIAALAHAWVVRSHLTHWWVYGTFFAVLAIAQAGYAAILTRRPGRRLAIVGIASNAGVLGLYVWSRTLGVPLGPHAGRPEAVGVPDLIAAGAEIALVVALLMKIRSGGIETRGRSRRGILPVVIVALISGGMTGPVGLHASPPAVTLASGPTTWAGPPPPIDVPEPVASDDPTIESEPAPVEPAPCDVKAASEVSAPEPAAAGHARAVLYSFESAIFMYDAAVDETLRLTSDDTDCWFHGPAFRNESYVSFETENVLVGYNLETGELDELVQSKSGIMASAWSPDGKTLAYLTYDSGDGGPQLAFFHPADGTKEVVRTFIPGEGRCGSEDDETTLSWAPDGHALIVVITHLADSDKTMYVVDPSGEDLIPPRSGTHARWAPDSKRIYYRDFIGDRKWYALNSDTGDRGTLGAMKPGTHGLAVSPDGSLLAYADGEDDVGVYVYEVAAKQQRRVADNAVAPVWIGPRNILVTDTKPCGEECFHSAWMPSGTASVVDVVTEERKDVAAQSTFEAEALIEAPASAMPEPTPEPSSSPIASPTPTESPNPLPIPTGDPTGEPTPSPSPAPTSYTRDSQPSS